MEPATAEPGSSSEPEDETRERLLAAAAEVFGEVGYDRAGVQEIARRAGFTTGAIYGRFRGKADLLVAAIGSQSSDEMEDLFAQYDAGRPLGDLLAALGADLVVEKFDRGRGLLLEAFVAARRDPEVAKVLREVVNARSNELMKIVEAAKATGAVDPSLDAFAISRFCHAVGFGFLIFGALGMDRPEPEPWQQLITRLVDAVAQEDE